MSRFLRDSIWLTGATAVATVANFFGQPILNYSLGPTGRGLLMLVQTVSGIAYELARLGSTQATNYLVAKGEPVPRVIATDLFFAPFAVITTAITLVALVFWTAGSETPVTWSIVVAGITLATARTLSAAFSGPMNGRQHFGAQSICTVIGSLTLLAARWFLVPHFGVPGAFWAEAITVGFAAVFAAWFVFRRYGRPSRPSRAIARQLVSYGVRTGLAIFATVIQSRVSPLMLYAILSTSAAGLYTAATAMLTPILILPGVISGVLRPRSSTMTDAMAIEQVGLVVRITLVVMTVGCLAVIPFAWWVVRLIGGPDFLDAVPALQVHILGMPPRAGMLLIVAHLSGHGRPEIEAASALTTAITTAMVGAIAIPLLGLPGAALADTIGAGVGLSIAIGQFMKAHGARVSDFCRPRSSDFHYLVQAMRRVATRK